MVKYRYLAIVLMLITTLGVSAQRNKTLKTKAETDVRPLVSAYMDSLFLFKAKQDTIVDVTSDTLDAKYAKLFVPMTFYNDIASHKMSLSSNVYSTISDEYLENVLLDIYMNRPDLVVADERSLDVERRKDIQEIESTIKNDPNIVAKVAPKAEEALPEPTGDLVITRPNFWKFSMDSYFQFMQNYVSRNWYQGGEDNYSLVGSVVFQYNYNNKQKVKWDNKLEMKLGLQTSKSDTLHKYKTTEDLVRYTGKLGLQATKKWYYTFQLIATTQFLKGYRSNDKTVYSNMLSPLTLNASVGMDYNMNFLKNKLTGTVHIAPLAYNMKFVERRELATRYGIDAGRHLKNDFGSEFTLDCTWRMRDNLSWRTRLYAYTSYKRAEIDMENTFTFKISKLLTAMVFVYPRFDDCRPRDDYHGYFEIKEFSSLGLSFSL